MTFRIKSCGLSDIGLIRKKNEDVFKEMPLQNFFTLADGMGGHPGGDYAAKETLNHLCSPLSQTLKQRKKWGAKDLSEKLHSLIIDTNSHVHEVGQKKFPGMGTTLCALLFNDDNLICAHVGDSRVYRYRGSTLSQLTEDHKRKKQVPIPGTDNFRMRTVLTRAIGPMKAIAPDIRISHVKKGDLYLVCSDGLTNLVPPKEISSILDQSLPLSKKVQLLINRAKQKGGNDNITVLLLETDEENLPRQQRDHASLP